MPLYEYRCASCDHGFEELVFGHRKPKCPRCGGRAEKQLSVFAVSGQGRGDAAAAPGSCGSCGDPGGPGACSR